MQEASQSAWGQRAAAIVMDFAFSLLHLLYVRRINGECSRITVSPRKAKPSSEWSYDRLELGKAVVLWGRTIRQTTLRARIQLVK
jgi:hypothetical protein